MTDSIEELRVEFANKIIARAAAYGDNAALARHLQKEFHCELIGEGSTRRVYASPLGVCVKYKG